MFFHREHEQTSLPLLVGDTLDGSEAGLAANAGDAQACGLDIPTMVVSEPTGG